MDHTHNSPVLTLTSLDFVLQSLATIGGRIPQRDGYILLIKRFNCRFCVEYAQPYEDFAMSFPNIGFLQFDAAIESEMMSQWSELVGEAYQVDGFPTLVAYTKNGQPFAIIKDRNNLDDEINRLFRR